MNKSTIFKRAKTLFLAFALTVYTFLFLKHFGAEYYLNPYYYLGIFLVTVIQDWLLDYLLKEKNS